MILLRGPYIYIHGRIYIYTYVYITFKAPNFRLTWTFLGVPFPPPFPSLLLWQSCGRCPASNHLTNAFFFFLPFVCFFSQNFLVVSFFLCLCLFFFLFLYLSASGVEGSCSAIIAHDDWPPVGSRAFSDLYCPFCACWSDTFHSLCFPYVIVLA